MLNETLVAGSHAENVGSAGVGPDAVPITLLVNGATRTLRAEPSMTLAEALRGPLGLTGTKIACNRGACSACTVWLDGLPVCACMMLAIDVGARRVSTIEGLAQGDTLHPVQQAFIDHDALQCGFCTPGMLMSCAALLERTPAPSADDVRATISCHYCRCGTYPRRIGSAGRRQWPQGLTMAKPENLRTETFPAGIAGVSLGTVQRQIPVDEPPPLPPNRELAVVGKSFPRPNGRAKVTGAVRFTVDVSLPGMLYGRILRSPLPHARVLSIDIAAAARHPGLRAIVTVAAPEHQQSATVRYIGAPVAVVAAVSMAAAEEALSLIKVDYQSLPFVAAMREARETAAPLIYDSDTAPAGHPSGFPAAANLPLNGNVRGPAISSRGNVAQGFAQADVVVEGEYSKCRPIAVWNLTRSSPIGAPTGLRFTCPPNSPPACGKSWRKSSVCRSIASA